MATGRSPGPCHQRPPEYRATERRHYFKRDVDHHHARLRHVAHTTDRASARWSKWPAYRVSLPRRGSTRTSSNGGPRPNRPEPAACRHHVPRPSSNQSRHAGGAVDDDNTRVTTQMDVDPEGFVENVADKLGILKARASGDLKRFKEFIESRPAETGGWRGDVSRPDA
jgi:hypothetical protein